MGGESCANAVVRGKGGAVGGFKWCGWRGRWYQISLVSTSSLVFLETGCFLTTAHHSFWMEVRQSCFLASQRKGHMNCNLGRIYSFAFGCRADWKKCMLSKEEEEKRTEEFKASFQPFDISADA